MRIKSFLFSSCFLLSIFFCKAQDTVYLNEGLVVNGIHHYGREALYTDLLAYQLYSGTLQQPKDGSVFGNNDSGKVVSWKIIKADSLHRLRTPGRMFANNSYIYVTYQSTKQQAAVLNTTGSSAVYVNGEPHAGDPYASGWLHIPVLLKKGLNEFYIRAGFGTTACIVFPPKAIVLAVDDPTVPVISLSENNSGLKGAVVVVNTSAKPLSGYTIKATVEGSEVQSVLPVIPAMATRKVIFDFDASHINQKGKYDLQLQLSNKDKKIAESKVVIEAAAVGEHYSTTFVSEIDGSLQYYAVTPQAGGDKNNAALFLSVHGAGVEAIGQARAYQPKDWGTLVAATNRRPRGFNWEDWGRLDALEVLHLGKQKFKPDPQHIYLTGHSMGGHGTWFLGATYPDKWAAIAPSAGYPTLKDYGSHDGKIPDSTDSPVEQLLLRAGNQSDVIKLAENYKPLGVYIFHGDSDRTVSVDYARQMRKVLGGFHTDFAYKEYPGGGHWISNESVDWLPIFNFFKGHIILPDSAVNLINFKTSSPGISSTYRWASIIQQNFPLQFSRIQLNRNNASAIITGSTENIRLLRLALDQFGAGKKVAITLDGLQTISYTTAAAHDTVYLKKENNQWTIAKAPAAEEKNPNRYGTFKDAFNHNMVFVYGTKGSKEENDWAYAKAKFDAETWYYRGNGAIDIIADVDYSIEKFSGRGVIIFGNAQTNAAWNVLLKESPVQVQRNKILVGGDTYTGEDLAAYFVYPLKNTAITSVAVIAGTGLKGMKAANANQYFAGASGFPDYMIFRLSMLAEGSKSVETAGFFDNDWKLDAANRVGK
ncbi:MAG: prolyl oligopeptidase family serine peptidase [Agriterribacter sp.]